MTVATLQSHAVTPAARIDHHGADCSCTVETKSTINATMLVVELFICDDQQMPDLFIPGFDKELFFRTKSSTKQQRAQQRAPHRTKSSHSKACTRASRAARRSTSHVTATSRRSDVRCSVGCRSPQPWRARTAQSSAHRKLLPLAQSSTTAPLAAGDASRVTRRGAGRVTCRISCARRLQLEFAASRTPALVAWTRQTHRRTWWRSMRRAWTWRLGLARLEGPGRLDAVGLGANQCCRHLVVASRMLSTFDRTAEGREGMQA